MKAEMKDLRKRIEKDRRQLENLEESIVTDSVSCGKKGKKSLGTVKVTGGPDCNTIQIAGKPYFIRVSGVFS